jgi:hypothetical protein
LRLVAPIVGVDLREVTVLASIPSRRLYRTASRDQGFSDLG